MKPEKQLYQWDVNQYLTGINPAAQYVDYTIGNEVIRLETDGTRCRIPDEVLQTYGGKTCYERYPDGTFRAYSFTVLYAPKPPDYVFTPEERTTFEALTARVDAAIEEIKRRADSGEFTPKKGVDYFTEAEKNELMESVSTGAIGEFRKVVDTATTEYNANAAEKLTTYDTNAEQRTTDYNRNAAEKLTEYNDNATEKLNSYNTNADNRVAEFNSHTEQIHTDISELKSDLTNKLPKSPTEWEEWTAEEQAMACKRMGVEYLGEWEEVVTVTTEEAVTVITVDTDANGNPFSLTHVICEFILPIEDTPKSRYLYFGSDSVIGAANAFSRASVDTNTAVKSEVVAYAKIISGKIYCDGSIGTTIPNGYQTARKYGIVNGYCMLSAESFDRIFVVTYNNAFPAGSKLIIRGIRK